MKVLVTGGCGFVGSNIVKKLESSGFQVSILDKFQNQDVRDYEGTRSMYENIDYVFHTAAEASIQKALQDPLEVLDVNIRGTYTVLKCSSEAKVKRLIFSSTSAVYGDIKGSNLEIQKEHCLNSYSISKLAGENLCRMFTSEHQLETIVLRYFNVFGNTNPRRGSYAPVIENFLNQKRSNQALTVVGSGNQKRDFVHVDDVVDANICAAMADSKYAGQIFNVGTGIGTSIIDVARLISDNITFLPERSGEIETSVASIFKINSFLNWSPKKDLASWIGEQQ